MQINTANGDGYYLNCEYSSIQYELKEDSISQTTIISTYNDPPMRCFLVYGGGSKYNSHLEDIDLSNLEIEINDKPIYYTNKDLLNADNQKNIKKGFSFFDPCGDYLELSLNYRKEMLGLCNEENLTRRALMILDQKSAPICNFKIKINDYNSEQYVESIESKFLTKKFSTPYLLSYDSEPLVIEIKLPEKMEIINYNLKEYTSSIDKNRIKWVVSEYPDERIQFWVEYKPSLAFIIDKIYENDYVRIILFILSLSAISSLFKSRKEKNSEKSIDTKFEESKINQGKQKPKKKKAKHKHLIL